MTLNALTIAGTDRKALLASGSLRVEDQLNARNTCEFTLRDATGAARPLVGQAVVVTVDGVVRFGGTIDRYREKNLANRASGAVVVYQIECVDYNQLADRSLVAETYSGLTMKQIVQDIVTDHLAGDGVTLDGAFPTGPTIEYMTFDYRSCAAAFDRLSEITGYFWNIGYDKVLNFLDRTTMTAPASLTQSSGADLAGSLEIERTREQYRNEQLIRGGQTRTQTVQIEEMKGDGATQTFPVALPIAQVPTVKVNSVTKTVGVRQVDTGKEWYWNEGDRAISQDSAGTKLTGSDTLRVEYVGYFPLLTVHREAVAVAERQAVEGGTGLYQRLEHDEEITQSSLARDRAAGLIRRFGAIHTEVSFESLVTGWRAGQLMPVSRAEHGLSGDYLLSNVVFAHRGLDDFRYQITAVSGEAVESWVAYFTDLAAAKRIARRSTNESRSEVLGLVRSFPESINVAESFAAALPAESIWHVGDQIGITEVAA